jgi:hypothetical protein
VGSCILDVSFTIDMNTESIAKRYGLSSYVENSIETMKRIIEDEYIQKAQGIAENVIMAGKPRLGVPDTYTSGQLVCSDEENFNLSGMSPNSIKDYAYDAAKCMHGRVIDDLNRVPGYTEAGIKVIGWMMTIVNVLSMGSIGMISKLSTGFISSLTSYKRS